jgi:hypothetical protein
MRGSSSASWAGAVAAVRPLHPLHARVSWVSSSSCCSPLGDPGRCTATSLAGPPPCSPWSPLARTLGCGDLRPRARVLLATASPSVRVRWCVHAWKVPWCCWPGGVGSASRVSASSGLGWHACARWCSAALAAVRRCLGAARRLARLRHRVLSVLRGPDLRFSPSIALWLLPTAAQRPLPRPRCWSGYPQPRLAVLSWALLHCSPRGLYRPPRSCGKADEPFSAQVYSAAQPTS